MMIRIGSLTAAMPYLPLLERVVDASGGAILVDADGVSFYKETAEEQEMWVPYQKKHPSGDPVDFMAYLKPEKAAVRQAA